MKGFSYNQCKSGSFYFFLLYLDKLDIAKGFFYFIDAVQ